MTFKMADYVVSPPMLILYLGKLKRSLGKLLGLMWKVTLKMADDVSDGVTYAIYLNRKIETIESLFFGKIMGFSVVSVGVAVYNGATYATFFFNSESWGDIEGRIKDVSLKILPLLR